MRDGRPEPGDPESICAGLGHRHRSSGAFIARASAELTDPRAVFGWDRPAKPGFRMARSTSSWRPRVELRSRRRCGPCRMAAGPARGGVVGAYVWDYARGMGFIRQFWDAAVAVDPAAASWIRVATGITVAGHLEATFRAAGFVAVEARSIAIPTVFADFDDLWLPFLGGTGGAPGYVATLDAAHRDAIREQLRRSVTAEPDGTIHLEARAWAVRARRDSTSGVTPPRTQEVWPPTRRSRCAALDGLDIQPYGCINAARLQRRPDLRRPCRRHPA